jgi:hypothetical protein
MAEVIQPIKRTQIKASTDMEPLGEIRICGPRGFRVFMELNWADEDHVHITLGESFRDPCIIVDATTNLMHILCILLQPMLYTVTDYRLDTGSVVDPNLLTVMQLAELRAFGTINLEITRT